MTTVTVEDLAAAIGVNAVTAQLPTFWTTDPELWFTHVEADFATANITQSKTKFNHVVKKLEASVATKVRHLLVGPRVPADADKYNALKAALLKVYNISAAERDRQFHALTLGDKQPSILLGEMTTLLPDGQDTPLYRRHFLNKLPDTIRLALAGKKGTLDELAEDANDLMDEFRLQTTGKNLLVADHIVPSPDPCEAEVNAVYARYGRARPQGKSRNAATPAPGKPKLTAAEAKAAGFCFFHARFGDAAKKCQIPCSYKPPKNADGS
jgi:hypothetical protein